MQRSSKQAQGLTTVAVILAAGRSERYGSNKLTVSLDGKPVWRCAVDAFLNHPEIDAVGIVCPGDQIIEYREGVPQALFVVAGGGTRTKSAQAGLALIPAETEIVLFHDAARPFVSRALVSRVIEAVRAHGAAFPALPVTDTIKSRSNGRFATLDRESLVSVQTPQGARTEYFKRAFEPGLEATDDMALLEAIGIQPVSVLGEATNRKITVPSDLKMTERRTGIGYDVHRFSSDPTRPLMLGGVLFDGPGLEGHSDADALIHSVVDALLGAAGKGDIGDRYPNTDPRWKDVASTVFLSDSAQELASDGWSVVNIDVSVLAERPKIGPLKDKIREKIAQAVGIQPERVCIKATTNEGLGAIGRGEGIASYAVATIERNT